VPKTEREAAVLGNLSHDPVVLKRIIGKLVLRVEQMDHLQGVLRRSHFGSTSERFTSPDHFSLFGKPQAFSRRTSPDVAG
jgi:hypothetical protein